VKTERIKKQTYKNRKLAMKDLANQIDASYSRTRRQGHLGGLRLEQFEGGQQRPKRRLH
jgi:hypothetical protein